METLCPASLVSNSNWLIHHGLGTPWTKEENKKFESALAIFDDKTPNRWFHVAAMIPGKSVYDVMNQYRELVEDVSDIEAGLVPVPGYMSSPFTLELAEDHRRFDACRKRGSRTHYSDQERKKGVPWTEDEHRRFLLGLQKHGKGDWRNISRNFVISKTPTQVASHAQKYYLRQLAGGKDKRRPSIHDITTVDLTNNNARSPTETKHDNKPNELQGPAVGSTPKALSDWNHGNDGANLMVFDSASHYIVNF
ncbi:transcription factor divaricata [Phtheirospermum japonicum]|uniref:Transcription factor divaricata n=1 Tax=Phtheirospermum japonicum TaxID=374723 RepID=A0A830BRV9_9LAMI|nr:transcription factor divaricata [Phtheirospermum japonicum]